MASYVISDIHGEYHKLMKLIEKINLKENDTLYILGDTVDRGKDSMLVLKQLMAMPNVVPLAGNHELMAIQCLSFLNKEITDQTVDTLDDIKIGKLLDWFCNGGKTTLDCFTQLSPEDRMMILDYLMEFDLYAEVYAGGKNYLLVHAGLDHFEEERPIDDYEIDELIWHRADYNRQYFSDKYVVTGHTPTMAIENNPRPGYIYKNKGNIAIDCGACYEGGRLAAFCLDTEEEFYVE